MGQPVYLIAQIVKMANIELKSIHGVVNGVRLVNQAQEEMIVICVQREHGDRQVVVVHFVLPDITAPHPV